MRKMLFIRIKSWHLIFIIFFLSSEIKSQIVIQDSIFSATLDMLGSAWNNAVIKRCTFSNFILSDGLRIANANNVIIDSCHFNNIQGNGIRFHNYGISNGVIVKNCTFDSIYGNGINSSEVHVNTQIINNTFSNIGLDTTGSSIGKPHHGIYFQGNNFLISGNRISNVYNANGSCISVRSNGIVRNNVLSDASKGISYYSDHPNVEPTLLVENNIVFNCPRGLSIANGGKQYVDSAIIRFNTIITNNLMCVSIGSGLSMINKIYGNILIRTDGSPIYIWAESPYDSTKNLLSSGDIGFADFLNHNYHITPHSTAYSFATGLEAYPSKDFENHSRYSSRLDAGADQVETSSYAFSNHKVEISFYPNPSKYKITFSGLAENFKGTISIYNTKGQLLSSEQKSGSQFKVNTGKLNKGNYFIQMKDEKGQLFTSKFMKE